MGFLKMISFKIIFLTLALCAAFVTCAPTEEIDAQNFVKESSDKMYEIVDHVAELAFDLTDFELEKDDSSSEEYEDSDEDASGWALLFMALVKIGIMEELTENITTFSNEAAKFKYGEFKNEELKRALQNIRMTPNLLILGDYNDPTDELDNAITNTDVCSFTEKTKCDLSYAKDIHEIIQKSNDPEELKYYWLKWRETNKVANKENVGKLAEVFTNASGIYDVTPTFFWYSSFKDEHFADEMTEVMEELLPLYKEFHAFIRTLLSKKFGADVVPPTGPIPAHIFEKIFVDEWDPKGIFSNLFTDEDMIDMKKVLKDAKITPRKMVDIAEDFYHKLGLSELGSEFWESRLKELTDAENDDMECRATIMDMSPKVYMKYCPDVDVRKFLQMHQWMARLHYAVEKKDVPFAFFNSYELEHPVGEAVILSTITNKHMKELGLTKGNNYESEEHEMDRLFRMGVHAIMRIPQYYIHSIVVKDLLNKVELDDLNNHYWELMKKYAGVVPPVERHADDFDFPFYFYKNIDQNIQTTKFISEIIGYQLYESLCSKSGQFEAGNDDKQLHDCDFHEQADAGKALKAMMELGSSKPWRQVLSVVTGNEDGMSAKPIIEYYTPISVWLKEENTKNGAVVGW